MVIFAGEKFCEYVGKTFHLGVIFTILFRLPVFSVESEMIIGNVLQYIVDLNFLEERSDLNYVQRVHFKFIQTAYKIDALSKLKEYMSMFKFWSCAHILPNSSHCERDEIPNTEF